MRVFFDTEFMETKNGIDLISIGLVREDDEELYLVSSEFDSQRAEADDWIRENVLAHIPETTARHPRLHIGEMIENWLWDVPKPEWWAYYGAYDFVALAQCWGRLLNLPKGWPRYFNDLKVLANTVNLTLPPNSGVEHHALADARWVKQAFDFCQPL